MYIHVCTVFRDVPTVLSHSVHVVRTQDSRCQAQARAARWGQPILRQTLSCTYGMIPTSSTKSGYLVHTSMYWLLCTSTIYWVDLESSGTLTQINIQVVHHDGIYHVLTMYILCIYQEPVYTWYIPCVYIHMILKFNFLEFSCIQ